MAGGYQERFKKLVKDLRPQIETVYSQEIHRDLKREEANFVLIDVRERDEYEMNHIPHALSLPKSIIERDIEYHVPNLEKKIVLYSREGYLAILSAINLQKMGYSNVFSLKGGFNAWTTAGLPVQKGEQIIQPDELEKENIDDQTDGSPEESNSVPNDSNTSGSSVK